MRDFWSGFWRVISSPHLKHLFWMAALLFWLWTIFNRIPSITEPLMMALYTWCALNCVVDLVTYEIKHGA